jgi:hypothetical protein
MPTGKWPIELTRTKFAAGCLYRISNIGRFMKNREADDEDA